MVPHQVLVVDTNRVRRITRSDYGLNVSTIQGIESLNRVVTIAGADAPGREDGIGQDSRFQTLKGVTMSKDGRIFVADALQCRLRRVSSALHIATPVTCKTRMVDMVRPSGCSMYDPPVDVFDRLMTPIADNVFYHENRSTELNILRCIGTPPPDIGVTSTGVVSLGLFGNVTSDSGLGTGG